MDILLDENGDIAIKESGDISLVNSVRQKVRIKLLWFFEEWQWDREEGFDYSNTLFIKNPNIPLIESTIRQKLFEITEVTEIKEVKVSVDNKSRKAKIIICVKSDYETVREEVMINV